jgi:alkylhydroperoxidase family enzyme
MARIEVPAGPGGDAVQIWALRPEMGSALQGLIDAAYNKSILPVRVREAARMRIAQLNDCSVCRNFRAQSVIDQGLSDDFYIHVGEHGSSGPEYSAKENLAVEFAERFATDHKGIDDDLFRRLRNEFTDPEVLDLTICLAAFLGLGRMLRVLGIEETTVQDV